MVQLQQKAGCKTYPLDINESCADGEPQRGWRGYAAMQITPHNAACAGGPVIEAAAFQRLSGTRSLFRVVPELNTSYLVLSPTSWIVSLYSLFEPFVAVILTL